MPTRHTVSNAGHRLTQRRRHRPSELRSRLCRRPPQPAAPSPHLLPPLPPAIVGAAVAAQARFRATYGGGSGGGGAHASAGAGGGVTEWVQTYYRRPRPDLAIGALTTALATPGALTGAAAFPGVVFLAHVVPRVCSDAAKAEALLRYGAEVARHSCDSGDAAEKVDTLVRALAWSGWAAPHATAVARDFAAAWRSRLTERSPAPSTVDAGGGEDDEGGAAALAAEARDVADSVVPPPGTDAAAVVAAGPASLLQAPVPSLDIGVLQRQVAQHLHWSFGCGSRSLFRYVRAVHRLAQGKRTGTDSKRGGSGNGEGGARVGAGAALDVAAVMPGLATLATTALVDGLWSLYYATGDRRAVLRVLDIGTPYAEFMDEYGDGYVTGYHGSHMQLPVELADNPYHAMRFETSRYALWTLLTNASSHLAVCEAVLHHCSELGERLSLMDPVSLEMDVTAFGKQQAALLAALVPPLQALRDHTAVHGIGSGEWPARYSSGGSDVGGEGDVAAMVAAVGRGGGPAAGAESAAPLFVADSGGAGWADAATPPSSPPPPPPPSPPHPMAAPALQSQAVFGGAATWPAAASSAGMGAGGAAPTAPLGPTADGSTRQLLRRLVVGGRASRW